MTPVTAHARPQAQACLPPRPVRAPHAFKLPGGSWDTHAHVIDGSPAVPFVPNRSYTPAPASPDEYIAMLDTVGIAYGVVIQVSVHGHDNRLIADALRRYPARLRGVVSIDGTESDGELAALRDLGVCGIRLNEHFSGGSGADRLQMLADRCRPLGWHVDLGLNGPRLRELAPALRNLNIRLVIDHLGFCPPDKGIDHADFRAVLDLSRMDDCWVKLSGAYRLAAKGAPYDDVAPFVRALCDTAPHRTIWAADWPNVALIDPARVPETGEQLDALHDWVRDPRQLHAVLVDNPMQLYGRPGTPVGDH